MKLQCLGHNPSGSCLLVRLFEVTIMLDCALELAPILLYAPQYVTPNFTSVSTPYAGNGNEGESSGNRENQGEINGKKEIQAKKVGIDSFVKLISEKYYLDAPIYAKSPSFYSIDLSLIDVILISNSDNILALPYIMRSGFNGRVIATEPAVEFGRQLMVELVTYTQSFGPRELVNWKEPEIFDSLPSSLKIAFQDGSDWLPLYSQEEIAKTISKIQRVSYREKVNLHSSIQAIPVSSGYSLGSANWILNSGSQKIAYISASSTSTQRHPEPLDSNSLMDSDVVILTELSKEPHRNLDQSLNDFCTLTGNTIKNGGNVLIPSYGSGIIYDLLEILNPYLANMSLAHVPIYLISPIAENSLANSTILGEWMSKSKQDKIFLPETPLTHPEMTKAGRLFHFPNIYSGSFGTKLKSPCIVFAGHPSLRCGDVVHLIKLWGNNPKHTLIMIDPDFNVNAALAPFQPLTMRVCYTPIDARLTYADANPLIEKIAPAHLIIPASYSTPFHDSQLNPSDPFQSFKSSLTPQPANPVHPPFSEILESTERAKSLTLDNSVTAKNAILAFDAMVTCFTHGQTQNVPLQRDYEKAMLSSKLAKSLFPKELDKVSVAPINGILSTLNTKYELTPANNAEIQTLNLKRQRYVWGNPKLEKVLESLEQKGIRDYSVKEVKNGQGFEIEIPSKKATIRLIPENTSIIVPDLQTRNLLKDVVLSQLMELY